MKELSQKPDYEMMWKVECEINQKLKQENARLREALEKITDLHGEDGSIMQRYAYEALERGE